MPGSNETSGGAGKTIGPASSTACNGGPQRDNIYTMSFAGANTAQGAPGAAALLKSAATVEVDAPEIAAAGSEASITVTVTNKGAGHYLPTGLTEFRQMWLAVYAENADGSRTEIGERRFGTVLKDADGKYPAEMWVAAGIQSDDRIPPRGAVTQSLSFKMPAGAQRATVVAVLNYKSIPDSLASAAGIENPTTEMASASKTIFGSQEAKNGAAPGSDRRTAPAGWVLPAATAVLLVVGSMAAVWVAKARRR